MQHTCGGCCKGAELFCAQCRSVAYCSPHCQKADWAVHKKSCSCRIAIVGITSPSTAFGRHLVRTSDHDAASIEITCFPSGPGHIVATYPKDKAFICGFLTWLSHRRREAVLASISIKLSGSHTNIVADKILQSCRIPKSISLRVGDNPTKAPSQDPDLHIMNFTTLLQKEGRNFLLQQDEKSAKEAFTSALLSLSEWDDYRPPRSDQRWLDLSLESVHRLVRLCNKMMSVNEAATWADSTLRLYMAGCTRDETQSNILIECATAFHRNREYTKAFLAAMKVRTTQESTDATYIIQDSRRRIDNFQLHLAQQMMALWGANEQREADIVALRNEKLYKGEDGGEDECVICCAQLDGMILELRCRHRYHDTCIETWLRQKPTCPTCREAAFAKQQTTNAKAK